MLYNFKRNNPLNIRFSKNNDWVGQVGEDNGFCVFKNNAYGFRAARIILKNYYKKGINTISGIITKWAPPSENPTEGYIEFVSAFVKNLGYGTSEEDFRNAPLDLGDDDLVCVLMAAMTAFESGKYVWSWDVKNMLDKLDEL